MKKHLAVLLSLVMLFSLFTACGDGTSATDTSASTSSEASVSVDDTSTEVVSNEGKTGDTSAPYIELALNVYYNDAEHSYYSRENGQSLIINGEGTYTLTFDCASDLSEDAKAAGVSTLTNLTAVYLLDMQTVASPAGQSTLTGCNIMYNSISVDGTELTITMTEPKSAFKSNGVFDTNDPINSWDGSVVTEVEAVDHVANFTTVSNPTTVSLTFTLSDMVWSGEANINTVDTSSYASDGSNPSVFSNMDFTSMTSLELTQYMGNGINLGNTFEASASGKNASVTTYETSWGQPVTTQAMIQGYKDAGFDTLRIPVAWTNTMDFENGDYTINDDYLARIGEVVQWALDAEMFVIINDHWDGGWTAMFGSNKQEDVDMGWKIYTEMWTQVATYFKDYSDMLIFESANEELGGNLNDNGDWASSGYLSKDGLYETTNAINQKFVDIVRSTGGNNTDRFLLIAGYDTNIANTLDSRYQMPTDTVDGKLFVSVHFYDPTNYCLGGDSGNLSRWGLKSECEAMETTLKKLTAFTDAGYGVIIGESGALAVWVDGAPVPQNNTVEWESYFLDTCTEIGGLVPVFWDTNGTYSKADCKIRDDEVAAVFKARMYANEAENPDAFLATATANKTALYDAALDMWEGVETYEAGTPVAWIMWNGGAGTYSVGDTFNPADNTAGITATNVVVDGSGKYSVSLDFAGGNSGLTFGALAIADGELLYPNCVIIIDSITVTDMNSGEVKELELSGVPYTSSDDGKCTRVNLLNEWVTDNPSEINGARNIQNNLKIASPVIIDKTDLVDISNITVNFTLVAH